MSSSRRTIVLVDDNLTNLSVGKNMLKTFYQVIPVPSAAALFETLEEITPDVILLDIEMPDMDGYETIQALKADDRWKEIPVIFLTAMADSDSEVEGFDLGAVDYITKPFSAPILLKRIEKELLFVNQKKELLEAQTKLKDHLDNLETIVQNKTDNVIRLQDAVFDTVIDVVEIRDKYTGGHIDRTQRYLEVLLGEMMKEGVYAETISGWDMAKIMAAAKLYDIGKIVVSDTIIGKDGTLTDEEFEGIKTHVTAGIDAIERIIKKTGDEDFYNHAIRMAGTHHENWDGSGYPFGLRGNNIPMEGRLVGIVSTYDALISERRHKPPLPHEEACEIIAGSSGKQFDPVIVEVFLDLKDRLKEISLSYSG